MRRAPLYSYVAAVACSALALGAVPALLVGLDLDRRWARLMAPGACSVLGMAFSYVWPALSWRWGLWLSSSFWLFFGFVFVALLAKGVPEWSPLFDALVVTGVGCAGAGLGKWLTRGARQGLERGV